MSNNAQQAAFPKQKQILGSGEDYHEIPGADGLTKREYFAAMAMQGMVANPAIMEALTSSQLIKGNGAERVAEVSVQYADALLNELSKSNP